MAGHSVNVSFQQLNKLFERMPRVQQALRQELAAMQTGDGGSKLYPRKAGEAAAAYSSRLWEEAWPDLWERTARASETTSCGIASAAPRAAPTYLLGGSMSEDSNSASECSTESSYESSSDSESNSESESETESDSDSNSDSESDSESELRGGSVWEMLRETLIVPDKPPQRLTTAHEMFGSPLELANPEDMEAARHSSLEKSLPASVLLRSLTQTYADVDRAVEEERENHATSARDMMLQGGSDSRSQITSLTQLEALVHD